MSRLSCVEKNKQMVVYTLQARWDYEGDVLLGVFSTEDKAEEAREHWQEKYVSFGSSCTIEYYEVEVDQIDYK